MPKVLVVDDNPVSRELIRELLESPELEILEASHGYEGLEAIQRSVPQLVLLDLEMPRMDGFGLLREIRRNPGFSGVRVMAITAAAMRGERERALAAGFDDYLSKPIEASALRSKVEQLLRQ